jgi:hypothetical protein
VGLGETPQTIPQVPIRVRLGQGVALGGAVLADDPARPPL